MRRTLEFWIRFVFSARVNSDRLDVVPCRRGSPGSRRRNWATAGNVGKGMRVSQTPGVYWAVSVIMKAYCRPMRVLLDWTRCRARAKMWWS